MRRDQEYVGRKMMEMELPERRKEGPKEKIFRCSKRRYGETWCKGDGC